jgi:hypothetical protein
MNKTKSNRPSAASRLRLNKESIKVLAADLEQAHGGIRRYFTDWPQASDFEANVCVF